MLPWRRRGGIYFGHESIIYYNNAMFVFHGEARGVFPLIQVWLIYFGLIGRDAAALGTAQNVPVMVKPA